MFCICSQERWDFPLCRLSVRAHLALSFGPSWAASGRCGHDALRNAAYHHSTEKVCAQGPQGGHRPSRRVPLHRVLATGWTGPGSRACIHALRALAPSGGAELAHRTRGPGAFGRRSRFLTTLLPSVVLDSLTTTGPGWQGRDAEVLAPRGVPLSQPGAARLVVNGSQAPHPPASSWAA